jgi:hypothetical protein
MAFWRRARISPKFAEPPPPRLLRAAAMARCCPIWLSWFSTSVISAASSSASLALCFSIASFMFPNRDTRSSLTVLAITGSLLR